VRRHDRGQEAGADLSARYPRVQRVGPLAPGITITRQYLYWGCPVTTALVGAVLRVRLTFRGAQAPYYGRIAARYSARIFLSQ
jgi:hypothetical protein